MSKASASTTLTVFKELTTFNQFLICDKGDLWQTYEGPASTPTKVAPDFSVTKPLLSLMVSSSRTGTTEIPDEVKYYLNDVLIGTITKSSSGYTKTANTDTAYSSSFDLLSPSENGGKYGLRIKKNLVSLTNGESGQIHAQFKISDGSSYSDLQTSCPFLISQVTENSSIVVIEAGDAYNFQITKDNTSVKLAAKYYRGLNEVTSGITYKWYKQVYGANPGGGSLANWQLITGATSAVLTVQEADVDTSNRYMVHVLDSTGTTILGQDTQMVYDASDLFEINMARDPSDGFARKDGMVTVTCTVYRRNSSSPVVLPSTATWAFIGVTPAGTPVFQQAAGSSNVCNVTREDIDAAGGQMELSVTVNF